MNCKYCGAEMDESLDAICPVCGKAQEQSQEEPKKKKLSIGKVIAATVACVLLLAVLAVAVIYGITGKLPQFAAPTESTKPTLDPTTTTAAPMTAADFGMIIEGLTDHKSFYAADDAVIANTEKVVATAGTYKLTNVQLQVGFWMEFYNYASSNSSYLSYYGLDPSKPLDEQMVRTSDGTWEQYFMDVALQAWHQYAVLNMMADEAAYQTSEIYDEAIASVSEDLKTTAEQYGFSGADELLQVDMGVGTTAAAYEAYMKLYYRAMDYVDHLYNTTELTREEVEQYFDKHADEIAAQYGITKDSGKLMDVRHILLQPKDGVADSRGYITATDEQWEACRAEAQAMLDAWAQAGAKEEEFAALANEHSTDGGSNTKGGLYEDVSAGQMVPAFNDWLFAEGRKEGDYGLVKTEFGYHLMYCAGGEDAWYLYGQELAVSFSITDRMNEKKEAVKLDVDLNSVMLGRPLELEEPEATTPTTTGK